MTFELKIKHEYGFDVGPFPPNVVLRGDGSGGYSGIDYWPTANPPTIAEIEAIVVPPAIPASVTPAQIRLWLLANYGATILTQIDGMLASIPDATEREEARVRWDYGLVVLRNDPLIVQFGLALGLSEAQIDQAFIDASQIQ